MRAFYHFYHLPHHRHKLSYLYTASIMRTFVLGIIGLFLPALIYIHYIPMGEQRSLTFVALFFLFYSTIQIPCILAASYLIHSVGIRYAFILSQGAMLGFFLFASGHHYFWALSMLAVVTAFWWLAYHYYFADMGSSKKLGKQVGMMEVFSVATGAVAPMVGGLLITFGGELALFYVAGLMTLGTIPVLIVMKEHHRPELITVKKIQQVWKTHAKDSLGFIGAGAEEAVYMLIWPLILYLIIGDILGLGIFYTIIMFVVAALNYSLGQVIDHSSNKSARIERIGAWAIFLSWIGRAAFQNPILISAFEIIHKVFYGFFRMPLLIASYNHSHHHRGTYLSLRQIMYKIGNICVLLIFLCIALLDLPLWLMMIVSALFALLPAQLDDFTSTN